MSEIRRIAAILVSDVVALKLNAKLTVKFMSDRFSKTPAVRQGLRKAGLSRD